jgi:hypothetical protein
LPGPINEVQIKGVFTPKLIIRYLEGTTKSETPFVAAFTCQAATFKSSSLDKVKHELKTLLDIAAVKMFEHMSFL